MSTRVPPPPEGLEDLLRESAVPLVASHSGHAAADDEAGAPSIGEAWPVFHLGADALSDAAEATTRAVPVGWRAVLQQGGTTALAEVQVDDGPMQVRSVSYGPQGAGLTRMRGVLERLGDDVAGGPDRELEERLLQVPAAYAMGLWLHDAQDPDRDTVVLIPPVPPGLEQGQAYPFAELCRLLAERVVETPP